MMSVITFESNAHQVVPLTEIGNFVEPNLSATGGRILSGLSCSSVACSRKSADTTQKETETFVTMTDGQPQEVGSRGQDQSSQNG